MTITNKRKRDNLKHNVKAKRDLKKRSLSLIEIIVVLMIMSVGASVVCIKISKALADNKLKESKRIIFEKFSQAVKLSKLTSSQVNIFFLNEDNRLFVYLDGEKIPNAVLKRKLKMKEEIFGLKSVEYQSLSTDEAPLVISITKERSTNLGTIALRLHSSPSIAYDLSLSDITTSNKDSKSNEDSNFTHELFPKDIIQEEEKAPIHSH